MSESIETKVARIEERQVAHHTELSHKLDRCLSAVEKHEGRIGVLENWRMWVIGISVGASLGAKALWSKLTGQS